MTPILKYVKLILAVAVMSATAPGAIQAETVAHWQFDHPESPQTLAEQGLKAYGAVKVRQAGPRSPEFPDLPADNHAVHLDGQGASLLAIGSGEKADFQFQNGDTITIEAWVNPTEIRSGNQVYVVSKGRTSMQKERYANQNWSLRMYGQNSAAHIDFLFTTRVDKQEPQWHRWRSTAGFAIASGWHHVALTYEFGKPDSIRGWIDGVPTDGEWGIAGPTSDPPVVDNDDVWLGTSMGRKANASFHGSMDGVAIHRARLSDEDIQSRYNRQGGPRLAGPIREQMPDLGDLPAGQVWFSVTEQFPRHNGWLHYHETLPAPTIQWQGDAFLLPRIPMRYDDWGIRSSWQAPVLLQMASDVDLPVGSQKLLLRARGLSRLWIDGKKIATTKADTVRYDGGRNPIHPPAEPPVPGVRPRRGNMQEVVAEVQIPSTEGTQVAGQKRRCRVVLEIVVGGRGVRTDSGEVCVAIATADGRSYDVLRPVGQERMPLTEEVAQRTLSRIEHDLQELDAATRRQAAASEDHFWEDRHARASEWIAQNPPPLVPSMPGNTNLHPIDAFILTKIQQTSPTERRSESSEAAHFHGKVLPILRQHCFRCHSEKDQGGLRLDRREAMLNGGDSGSPAVTPGHPHESELLIRIQSDDESVRMPPTGKGLTAEQVTLIKDWILSGASWPERPSEMTAVELPQRIDDAAFLRRLFLDTVGVPPTREELERFLSSQASDKRNKWIELMLADKRVADHWVSFWQDLLAENPSLISATLNSTGPFRWFIHESLQDQKPLDRMVTELVMMRGSAHEGGSAGFSLAGGNDSPFAAKGHILASAFMGIELKCARCHDSPYHSSTQHDLYALAAMINRKPLNVPKSSQVPAAFFEKQTRESLIRVSIKPNQPIKPTWPFAKETGVKDDAGIDAVVHNPQDTRERLAALITSPENRRFSQVVVNHFWKRLMGAGFVEPAHDWEGQEISHPELLDWLAAEFVSHGYDVRHILRLIMTSEAYQRVPVGQNANAPADSRFFNAPDRRRLTAEQLVDALHVATGSPFEAEILSFDPEGRTTMNYRLNLGKPTRAWMLADLKNERDRPSLSLPRNRMMVDMLEVFGWKGARQEPIAQRSQDPNVLQPGILANSVLTTNLTRASVDSQLADLAIRAESTETLVDTLFRQILNRPPNSQEMRDCVAVIARGFNQRHVPSGEIQPVHALPQLPQVTWFNHAQSEANTIQTTNEERLRQGPPGDPRLRTEWRERFEDVVWSLVNHPEFVWVP